MTLFRLFIPNRFWKTSLYRALVAQDFVRAAQSGNPDPKKRFAGGPGSSVARKIIETHNGRIELKNQEESGTML